MTALLLLILALFAPPAKPRHLTLRDPLVWICVPTPTGEACKSAGDVGRYITGDARDDCSE